MKIYRMCWLLFVISTMGCDTLLNNGYVKISNRTDVDISCLIPLDTYYQDRSLMETDVRDTATYDLNRKIAPFGCINVSANSSRECVSIGLNGRWKRIFYNDTLYIEIFPKGVIYDHSLYEIITNKLILQEYKIAYEQFETLLLKDNTFYITYPPTPEMKDIKMWPPYEEAIKNAQD